MRCPLILAFLAAFVVSVPLVSANGQPADTGAQPADNGGQLADTGNFHIVWEVKNRFRLFRKEADFLHQVAASRGDGVLAEERRLEVANGGVGWAQDVVGNLCLDDYGNLLQTCNRDGANENYLDPRDHSVGVAISGPVPQGQTCAWTFDDGSGPLRPVSAPCDAEVKVRVRSGHATVATVDIPLGDGTAQRVTAEVNVRDLLIAGLGDFIAAGEGDPDQAVQLEGGFCFRRFGGGQYYRPGRAGFTGDRSCESGPASDAAAKDWAHHGARWMSPRVPSFALQLPNPYRARARHRAAARRDHLPAARLQRSFDRRRNVQRTKFRRLPDRRRIGCLRRNGACSADRAESAHGAGTQAGPAA